MTGAQTTKAITTVDEDSAKEACYDERRFRKEEKQAFVMAMIFLCQLSPQVLVERKENTLFCTDDAKGTK